MGSMRTTKEIERDIEATRTRMALDFETPAPVLKDKLERLARELVRVRAAVRHLGSDAAHGGGL